jgi:hypothetical protein
MMDGQGNPAQYTICRPIGVTNLPQESYVMIQSEHVETYLRNKENPYAKLSKREMDISRDDYFTKMGLYEKHDGKYTWKGHPVGEIFSEATRERDKAEKDAKKAFFEAEAKAGRFPVGTPENPGKGTRAKTAHTFVSKVEAPIMFTPKEFHDEYLKAMESYKASDDFKTARERAEALLKQYTTMGGPDGITPQREVTWLRGAPPEKVKSYMIRYLTDPAGVTEEIKKHLGDQVLQKEAAGTATPPVGGTRG